jgi:hypothetical protein
MMDDRTDAEDRLLEGSKRDFDTAVEATDIRVAAGLRAARLRALEHAGVRAWLAPSRLWMPAAVAAGLTAIVLVPRIELGGAGDGHELAPVAAVDLELLLGEAEFEMFAELEFYEWLDMQEGEPAGDGTEDGVG